MADQDGRGSEYSDEDLDELDEHVLVELEQNAIQSTQAAAAAAAAIHRLPSPASDYGDELGDEDLDDAIVIDEARNAASAAVQGYTGAARGPSLQEQFRLQRYGQPQASGVTNHARNEQHIHAQPSKWQPPTTFVERPRQTNLSRPSQFVADEQGDDDVDMLQKKVQELLAERHALQQELNAKSGEISIIRSKTEKLVVDTSRELAAARKLHADQLARKQHEVDALRVTERNTRTELDFTRQEIAEELERSKRTSKTKPSETDALHVTPRKKKAAAHRDGFDEDIEFLSPTKLASPSKLRKAAIATSSPSRAGNKRKRKTAESPRAGALDLVQNGGVMGFELDAAPEQDSLPPAGVRATANEPDDRFEFLGDMLDYRSARGDSPIIERLGQYALPSAPRKTLQSIILGAVPSMSGNDPVHGLPTCFVEVLLGIWDRCLGENFLKPIGLLLRLLSHALERKCESLAPRIIDKLLPLALRTADLVAIPRFNSKPARAYEEDIDVTACLSIVHLGALGCSSSTEHLEHFWKLMRWDFVLMMLSQNQPTEHFELMLLILSTSITRDSFGTMADSLDAEFSSAQNVGYIIERLTWPLYETPFLPMSTQRLDAVVLARLRGKIIRLLIDMTRSPYAGRALATHAKAIGRLVSFLSDELDALYDHDARHRDTAALITLAVRLLYHLVTRHEDAVVDMPTKLATIRGGAQKYLLVLARLNFAEEDGVLARGVGADVQGYALELLEDVVTPEEAEAVEEAFVGG